MYFSKDQYENSLIGNEIYSPKEKAMSAFMAGVMTIALIALGVIFWAMMTPVKR